MKKYIHLTLTITLCFLLTTGWAQDKESSKSDSKIVVEITKEINGEKKTFHGEYENEEQMRSDPNYQEFAGENPDFGFWFGKDSGDENLKQRIEELKNQGHFFNFNFSDDEEGPNTFFKRFDGDSMKVFHFDSFGDDDWSEEFNERMKEFGIHMEALVDKLHDDDHKVFFFSKKIEITDVDDEFGKKGQVNKNNVLELDDLTFSPNPSSNGRFKVRFRVPQEDELSIKVFNLEGKEIYNRYFERFGGTYSETIDLSDQEDGIYLLEISQANKRMTKKIVIN